MTPGGWWIMLLMSFLSGLVFELAEDGVWGHRVLLAAVIGVGIKVFCDAVRNEE